MTSNNVAGNNPQKSFSIELEKAEAISAFKKKLEISGDCDMERFAQNLTELDMSMTDVKTIAPFMCFSNLVKLDASMNWISHIPSEIGELTKLQQLSFYSNRIVEIPESIGNLTALKELYLDSNRIENFPDTMGKLNQLELLFLDDNQKINSIPDCIGGMTSLKILRMNYTIVSSISEKILQLPNLEEVHLCATVIPDDHPTLTALSNKGVKIL